MKSSKILEPTARHHPWLLKRGQGEFLKLTISLLRKIPSACQGVFQLIFGCLFLLSAINCSQNQTLVQPQPFDASLKGSDITIIQQISFVEEKDYTRIAIEGTEPITQPFYMLLSDPLRISIEIPNADLKIIKEPVVIDNGTITQVSVKPYDDKERIDIGLTQVVNYNILKKDRNLYIDIEKIRGGDKVKAAKKDEELVKEKEVEKPLVEPKKEEPPPIKPAEGPPLAPVVVSSAKEIVNLLSEHQKDSFIFTIVADGNVRDFKSFRLDSPPRLVLDIQGVGSRYPKKAIKLKNPFIKEIRIGHHPDKVRFVFDSMKPKLSPHQIDQQDNRLLVSFGKPPKPFETKDTLTPKEKGKTFKPITLTDIDFKETENKSRIVVSLTGEPQFEDYSISKKEVVVNIKNAFAPKHLRRGMDTSEFKGVVNYIDIKNIKMRKTQDIRISIKLKEEVPYETTKEGKFLFIDIDRSKKGETKREAVPIAKDEKILLEHKKEEIKKEEEKPALGPPPELKEAKKLEEEKKGDEEKKIYRGRKISLDFKDADIKNLLRLIAEVSNLNIIAGDDVSGKVTMRLLDVPWDQALDIILQAKGLGMHQEGNVIRIAPIAKLKKEVEEELSAKRAKERLEDLIIELIPVNYATAKDIIPQVKSVLSDRGDVKVDDRTNTLIVRDIPKNIAGVKNLVKSLDTKTPQVLIEARIVEANLTFQKELGVKWGFEIGGGTATAGGGGIGSTLGTATREAVDLPAVPRGSVPGGLVSSGIVEFLFSRGTLRQLDIAISAHENKGDVKIISSPKIATLDNKEASIEQGLRIPYRKLTLEGVSIDFIEANLKLTVTPHVTNDGKIKLNIKAKKDAPDQTIVVDSVPSIDKKEAITEVLVNDGGVIVIAGVYSIELTNAGEGIPLFSKIPLLGWLFKRETKEDKRKDLLIFISPKIIKDMV